MSATSKHIAAFAIATAVGFTALIPLEAAAMHPVLSKRDVGIETAEHAVASIYYKLATGTFKNSDVNLLNWVELGLMEAGIDVTKGDGLSVLGYTPESYRRFRMMVLGIVHDRAKPYPGL